MRAMQQDETIFSVSLPPAPQSLAERLVAAKNRSFTLLVLYGFVERDPSHVNELARAAAKQTRVQMLLLFFLLFY